MDNDTLLSLTAEIVVAHVSFNKVDVSEVGRLVEHVHRALNSLGQEKFQRKEPTVSIKASIRPDRLVCMECGTSHKLLRRHLTVAHDMSPEEYRRDYGLPANYPMIAAEYADKRRQIAKSLGLGRKRTANVDTAEAAHAKTQSDDAVPATEVKV